jgi:hypothetical protein
MTEALRHLAESEELQPLVTDARAQDSDVVIEVFYGGDGRVLLVVPKKSA